MLFRWFEACLQTGSANLLDGRVDQTMVHPADKLGVRRGQPIERTVPQDHGAVVIDVWLVSLTFEKVHDRGSTDRRSPCVATRQSSLDEFTPVAATLVRDSIERILERTFLGQRTIHCLCEQLSGEAVIPRRQCDRDVLGHASIHLRRPPRTRTCSARETLEVDLEQSVCHETVEVMRRRTAFKPCGVGSLVASDPIIDAGDIVIQPTAGRLAERTHRSNRIFH